MVFGKVAEERIQLNEDTLWSGEPTDYNRPGASGHLAEIRRLIAEQKFGEAEKLEDQTMLGSPHFQASYQTLGDLNLRFEGQGDAQAYRRELDMADSMVRVTYRIGSVTYGREIFLSFPDQVMAVHLTCDKPGGLTFGLDFSSPHPHQATAMNGQVQIGFFKGEVPLSILVINHCR